MSRAAISCGDNNERAVCAVAHRTRVGSEPPAVRRATGVLFFLLMGSRGQHPEQHAACGGVTTTARGCSGSGRRSPSRVFAAAATKKAVPTFFMLFVFFVFASPHYALPPGGPKCRRLRPVALPDFRRDQVFPERSRRQASAICCSLRASLSFSYLFCAQNIVVVRQHRPQVWASGLSAVSQPSRVE